ncbi:hypothetical protein EYF80_059923 [Liparis tanakae]|uniref:Uncharacterized protein n=1 Tax=Liparis tanakae TaxID=230148 RepID=A0A4Z2ELU3_9TELE|nr:hypothetical protein EYF80_059923 [Liparis tanakae]
MPKSASAPASPPRHIYPICQWKKKRRRRKSRSHSVLR